MKIGTLFSDKKMILGGKDHVGEDLIISNYKR